MAQQSGLIQLTGRVGNVTFYKAEEKFRARISRGINGSRVKTHPAFARTRENAAEFQRAIKATSLFRRAFVGKSTAMSDNTVFHRLASILHKLLGQDTTNNRGGRKVLPQTLPALEGFVFNQHKSLRSIFNAPFEPSIDRASGSLSVNIDSFSPVSAILKPQGASHAILVATAALVNIDDSVKISKTAESIPINLSAPHQEALHLSVTNEQKNYTMMLAFGVRFVEIINGFSYDIKGKNHGAMEIVKIDVGVSG